MELRTEGGSPSSWFGTPYYNECHALFRKLTDQPERMLVDVREICRGRPCARILSVGSGTGLFEIPMLEMLADGGKNVELFVGIDVNREACIQLTRRLEDVKANISEWQVLARAFEDYRPDERFDVVMFNHSFEYLSGSPAHWIRKSLRLLTDDGICLIYSPDRGGINALYAELSMEARRRAPRFSDDLEAALEAEGILYSKRTIQGLCSVEPLERSGNDVERTRLLSFLSQIDCREIDQGQRQEMTEHYLGLRAVGEATIPHPTTRFLITNDDVGGAEK